MPPMLATNISASPAATARLPALLKDKTTCSGMKPEAAFPPCSVERCSCLALSLAQDDGPPSGEPRQQSRGWCACLGSRSEMPGASQRIAERDCELQTYIHFPAPVSRCRESGSSPPQSHATSKGDHVEYVT
jgi:hypothetical protein